MWGVLTGVLGSLFTANQAKKDAANSANAAVAQGNQAAIEEQRRQFDAIQALLKPYVQAGTGALTAQQNLIGLGGPQAQQDAIAALQQGPQFQSMLQQGENSILQNAAATGGLRGGNTQAALAQFSPQLLSELINQQYNKLGGLTSLGQNSAVGQGNAGIQTGQNIASLLQSTGNAQAAAALAKGQANSDFAGSLAKIGGSFFGKLF